MIMRMLRAELRKFSINNPDIQKNGESSSCGKNSVPSLSETLKDNICSIDFKQPHCSQSSGAIYELKRMEIINYFTR